MTEEQVNRILQPFMQADGSTTRKYGGTGLGLTITNNFIELMGSKLEIESSYGLGTKFSFDITFQTVDETTTISKIAPLANINEKPIFDSEILVCEDNLLNQMVISDHLSKVGIKTVIAGNGKIGVDFVKERIDNNEKPFDLIFMDIHMPEMDGLEAAKKIIEIEKKSPIIALTANIMTNDRETYLESGMRDCLSKPFVAYDLWTCLLKYLKPVSMLTIKHEIDYAEEEEQYMELVTSFIKSNQTTINDINYAIGSGDLKLAHRLAHTLKGVAGIVGMTALVEAAQTVEHSLLAGKQESLDRQIIILENELNKALDELKPLMDKYVGDVKNKYSNIVLNKEDSIKLLEKLDLLLESDNFDSLDLINDLDMIPGTMQLASLVENMKFKQARQELAVIKQQLEDSDGE
jgi:CheY-like chemotaxis protein